ncbi:hypothetical protein MNBD_ALPHA04-596 [hydrothermal vent metagenome]|uniref:HTH gntR-type domain-containing protein n=1 Tax=hydrothermal vent metagenome TaxID=652676 RepID=A0A3B0S549_9ZZZZ
MNKPMANKGPQSARTGGKDFGEVRSGTIRSVAVEMSDRIYSGRYKNGQRLPAERHLSGELHVSRTTLRQSMDLLENAGMIVRRAGSGTFVSYTPQVEDTPKRQAADTAEISIDILDTAEQTSPLELNVVRSVVEPEIVRLAVINMSARDMAKLGAIIDRMEKVTTSAADFSTCDEDFHLCLAEGTHNQLLATIYRMITHVRRHSTWAETREKVLSPNRIEDYKKKHRSLYQAIRNRDIETAVEYMKLHIIEVQRDLISV